MEINQCFKLLNISPCSTIEDVKQAYKDQVNIWHPDRFMHESDQLQTKAVEQTKLINIAYKKIMTHIPLGQE